MIALPCVAAPASLAACGSDAPLDMPLITIDGSAADGVAGDGDASPPSCADCGARDADAANDAGIPSDGDSGDSGDSGESGDASVDASAEVGEGGDSSVSHSRLVLFGGTGGGTSLGDTWLFDGSAWTQFIGAGPPARSQSPAMATLDGKAVLFGGSILLDGGSIVGPDGGHFHTVIGDDTWAFDGAGWTHVAASPSPPARDSASMALLGDRLVLFGGQNLGASQPSLDDTWTFDANGFATGWSVRTTTASPETPVSSAMAPLNGTLVLFGGVSSAAQASTWSFDGTDWTRLPATSPPPRFGAAMAPLDGKLVMFGGFDNQGFKNLDETWTFDGSTWMKLAASGPSARTNAIMAPLNGKLVLFGGFDGQDEGDTWTFDGTQWTKLNVVGPPGRWLAAMTTLQSR